MKALLFAATMSLAAAAVADPLTIYSYRQDYLLQPLVDAFTESSGIEVEVVYADSGFVERLRGEGRLTPASLVVASDIGRLLEFSEAGLSQAVESETLTSRVPAAFRDPNNEWFALTLRARIAYASVERVPEGSLTRYEDLADPAFAGKLCLRDGQHPYNIALFADLTQRWGEEAVSAWLTGLRANLARSPSGNDRAQINAVAAGECDIAIGNTYYYGIMLNDPAQRPAAEAVYPVFLDAGEGTHMNVSGIVMTSQAPDPEAALSFMEFMVSDEAQGLYASLNSEYPVVEGVALDPLVESWGSFQPANTPLAQIAENRPRASDLVDSAELNY